MTVLEYLHRIGRRARGGDFTALSMTEKGDLMECANAALQTVYGMLPSYFKERTQGFVLPAPEAITLEVAPGSAVVPDDTFDISELGRSVVIDGDGNWNQVAATNRLLNPYLGSQASANMGATIYGDAVYSDDYPFDRIIGNPTFPNQGQTMLLNLSITNVNNAPWWSWQPAQGVPRAWWTQMLGNSSGNEPLLVLRFSPAPNIAYAIDVRINYWPKRLTLSDYQNATTLPVPDQFLEKSLIPIALRQLMSSPIWDNLGNPAGDDRIIESADRGEEFLRMIPGQVTAPNNRVGTPWGY